MGSGLIQKFGTEKRAVCNTSVFSDQRLGTTIPACWSVHPPPERNIAKLRPAGAFDKKIRPLTKQMRNWFIREGKNRKRRRFPFFQMLQTTVNHFKLTLLIGFQSVFFSANDALWRNVCSSNPHRKSICPMKHVFFLLSFPPLVFQFDQCCKRLMVITDEQLSYMKCFEQMSARMGGKEEGGPTHPARPLRHVSLCLRGVCRKCLLKSLTATFSNCREFG